MDCCPPGASTGTTLAGARKRYGRESDIGAEAIWGWKRCMRRSKTLSPPGGAITLSVVMRTYESLLALIEELKGDATEIERILQRNRTAWVRIENGANDPVDWGAVGFTIHTLYGVLENYFLRISRYFENDLPSDRWHQSLVERMKLEIPGVRPALFADDRHVKHVKEILRFRHRIRNLYGEDLDPKKTTDVQKVVEEFFSEFPGIHERFIEKLRSIADAL